MTAVLLPPIKSFASHRRFLAWRCIRQSSCPVSALYCCWAAQATQLQCQHPSPTVSGWKGPETPALPPIWSRGRQWQWFSGWWTCRARWEGHEKIQIAMSEKQHNIHIASLVLGIATMHSFLLSLEPLRPVMNGVPVIGNGPFKRMFPLICFPP